MRKIIRLTESDLRNIVKMAAESVAKEDASSNIQYAAIVLTDESRGRLLQHVWGHFPDWTDYRTVCHHSTVFFHNNMTDELHEWCKENEGKIHRMVATGYGMSDKAFAVTVKSNTPTANKIKHITVAVNNSEGGKPVDSNFITKWHSMEPVELEGTVEIFYRK